MAPRRRARATAHPQPGPPLTRATLIRGVHGASTGVHCCPLVRGRGTGPSFPLPFLLSALLWGSWQHPAFPTPRAAAATFLSCPPSPPPLPPSSTHFSLVPCHLTTRADLGSTQVAQPPAHTPYTVRDSELACPSEPQAPHHRPIPRSQETPRGPGSSDLSAQPPLPSQNPPHPRGACWGAGSSDLWSRHHGAKELGEAP